MPLSPNSHLGTYEVLGPLGVGGMGEVYRARDTRLGRDVAIKVLPADVASSPDRLARFEREAKTVAGLNHPNIVVLHTVEDVEGVRFLTMEVVEGKTLSTLVSPGGLPVSRLLELAIPLTDALVAAHEKGVIHRDLKPSNVMVTREGRVKVLDFGLAKTIGAGSIAAPGVPFSVPVESQISGEGHVVGTVPYMAPEQLRGEAVDARSDLFSLGVILYELATGSRPFTGTTPAAVISSILHDNPEPLARGRSDLLRELGAIVARCLEKDPSHRPQAASDVRNQLAILRQRNDDWAATYDLHVREEDRYPFLGYEAALDGVVVAASPTPPCTVLDLGIGTGNLAVRFAARGCEIWGLDVSPRMLARASRKIPDANLAAADLLGDWPGGFHRRFDHIVSAYTFHHFSLAKKLSILNRLSRHHCLPGSRIIIADISFPTTEALAQAREKWRDAWDEEEYWVAEEAVPACIAAGFRTRYEQVSEVAGIYVLTPDGPDTPPEGHAGGAHESPTLDGMTTQSLDRPVNTDDS